MYWLEVVGLSALVGLVIGGLRVAITWWIDR
jgi:uncharacterized membrane protein YwzB